MNCPDCQVEMNRSDYEGVPVDICPKCEGVWLDRKEIGQIVEKKEEKFTAEERIGAFAQLPQQEKVERVIACPKCGQDMRKFNYAISSGVILDRCPQKHGIWLDKAELERIQIVMEEYDRTYQVARQESKREISGQKKCPRCGILLNEMDYEGMKLDLCSSCQGLWCDSDELHQVVDRREKKFTEQDFKEVTAREEDARVSTQPELIDVLKCPICDDLMDRRNYSYSSGVMIDKCLKGHGIWLDKDEIEKIQLFIERGEGRAQEDLTKYGSVLKEVRKETERRREESIKELKVSRFGGANRFFQMMARREMI